MEQYKGTDKNYVVDNSNPLGNGRVETPVQYPRSDEERNVNTTTKSPQAATEPATKCNCGMCADCNSY